MTKTEAIKLFTQPVVEPVKSIGEQVAEEFVVVWPSAPGNDHTRFNVPRDINGGYVIKGRADILQSKVAALCEEAIRRDREQAYDYAVRLAEYAAKKYPDMSPDWKPLSDIMGVLSQIDNAITGLVHKSAREQCDGTPVAVAPQPLDYEAEVKRYIPWIKNDSGIVGYLAHFLQSHDARSGTKPVYRETPEQVAAKYIIDGWQSNTESHGVALVGADRRCGYHFHARPIDKGEIIKILASIIRADREASGVKAEPVSKYPAGTIWNYGNNNRSWFCSDGQNFFEANLSGVTSVPTKFSQVELMAAPFGGLYQCDSTGKRIVSNPNAKVQP